MGRRVSASDLSIHCHNRLHADVPSARYGTQMLRLCVSKHSSVIVRLMCTAVSVFTGARSHERVSKGGSSGGGL